MSNERSNFDNQMMRQFNPNNRENYAPMFNFRTQSDSCLQKQWCPSCANNKLNLPSQWEKGGVQRMPSMNSSQMVRCDNGDTREEYYR